MIIPVLLEYDEDIEAKDSSNGETISLDLAKSLIKWNSKE